MKKRSARTCSTSSAAAILGSLGGKATARARRARSRPVRSSDFSIRRAKKRRK